MKAFATPRMTITTPEHYLVPWNKICVQCWSNDCATMTKPSTRRAIRPNLQVLDLLEFELDLPCKVGRFHTTMANDGLLSFFPRAARELIN